jgi:cytochrome b6-f complex iron-sulfur subunit
VTEQTTSHDNRTGPSRRTVLVLGAAGASTVALAACSKAKTSESSGTTPPAATPASSSPGTSSPPASGGKALARVADVPVGGAISAKDDGGGDIIITRPTDTTVAAFSAICTHQGCTVHPGSDTFVCPCHGSTYDAKTGNRISGPARSGLSKVSVQVSGQNIVAG